MRERVIVSCEHGGNRIPRQYAGLFEAADVDTHRAYDLGALAVARRLATRLHAPLFFATVSRLVVDLNRSRHHRRLFSAPVAILGAAARERIIRCHYAPYREAVERRVRHLVAGNARVVHVSVHSFTPTIAGKTRNADVGLLYDPRRSGERRLCLTWQHALARTAARLRVRRNYPYRGAADGFTTHLRRVFPERVYLGIELELNQALLRRAGRNREAAVRAVIDALMDVVG